MGSAGARDGYAEFFKFRCCGRVVRDFLATSGDVPSQFRADGCQQIPARIRFTPLRPANPYWSALVAAYRRLEGAGA